MISPICRFLWDEAGSVLVGDWVFVTAILMLGAVAGVVALHSAPREEAVDAPSAAPAPAAHAPVLIDRR